MQYPDPFGEGKPVTMAKALEAVNSFLGAFLLGNDQGRLRGVLIFDK